MDGACTQETLKMGIKVTIAIAIESKLYKEHAYYTGDSLLGCSAVVPFIAHPLANDELPFNRPELLVITWYRPLRSIENCLVKMRSWSISDDVIFCARLNCLLEIVWPMKNAVDKRR